MREILFRGKPLGDLHGKFIYGSLGVLNTDLCAIYHCFEFKDDEMELVYINTVGQYTGLTDKNGKKIFEGDIVTMPKYGGGRHKSVVYFRKGKFAVDGSNYGFKDICPKNMKVVGNIHDNPELLEVEE